MDPDACLEELRLLVLAQQHDPPDVEHTPLLRYLQRRQRETLPVGRRADPARMAELFDALDKWLQRGGFPPKAWQPPPAVLP